MPCDRPRGTHPINYLFINDSEFYKLVDDEINTQLGVSNGSSGGGGGGIRHKKLAQELADARGRYRYKYERIVLKGLHFSQPWFKMNLDREGASELLRKSGIVNGKFIVRANSTR